MTFLQAAPEEAIIAANDAPKATESADRSPKLYYNPEEKKRENSKVIIEDLPLKMGFLVEAEMSYMKQGQQQESDVVLSTFQWNLESTINENVSGHASVLWEEDDTDPLNIDEVYATLTWPQGGTSMDVGRMYVPFGKFESHFISDPMTLELGETRESAITLKQDFKKINFKLSVFNGDTDEGPTENKLLDAVAAIGLDPHENLQFGGYWMSDIGETDALGEDISTTASGLYEKHPGFGAWMNLVVRQFHFNFEYIKAASEFAAGALSVGRQPSAWNSEVTWQFNNTWETSLRYEGSDDFLNFPNKQYGITCARSLFKSASWAIEYLHGEFDVGTSDRNMLTTQLGVEF